MGFLFKASDPFYRHFEKASIVLCLVLVLALSLLSLLAPKPAAVSSSGASALSAHAHAMPGRGWVPLTVYYSAFGSGGDSSVGLTYEWDLDGNGFFDFTTNEPGGYAQYSYSKPGLYTIQLRVTDSGGNQALDSLQVEILHPTDSSVDYWGVFEDSSVRKVTFEVSQADWERIWADIEAKQTIPADAVVFGRRLEDVGLRMRGQFSLRESGEKKPWKIDTDYYIEGQEYQNLKQLLFINNIGDPTLVREKLAYEMMAFAGLPSSFTCYVQVWVDIVDDELPPEFWGVYTLIERVDRKFIANRFGQDAKSGNLYKASHAQRGPMDLVYYGDSIDDFPSQNGQVAYGKMTNEEDADYSDIIQLTQVIDGTEYDTPEDFAAALEAVFNVDAFLRYMAVVDATMNWDVYPYTGNNFYLFHHPGSGRFEWIPWDLTWGDNPQHPIFEATEPGLAERTPLHTRVFQVPEYRLRYAAYLDLLMRHFFNPLAIGGRARTLQRLVAPHLVLGDGDKLYSSPEEIDLEVFQNNWRELADLVGRRNAYLQERLLDYKEAPVWDSQRTRLPEMNPSNSDPE